jgi:hypothetical protein
MADFQSAEEQEYELIKTKAFSRFLASVDYEPRNFSQLIACMDVNSKSSGVISLRKLKQ